MKERLQRVPLPDELGARRRAWSVVRPAFERRERVSWPVRHARALVAAAVVAALVAAALTSPGRAVIHSLRKAVGIERAEEALFSLPARGRLLVTSPRGVWIIRDDGSRRFLGRYRDASWSPHGLFLAAARRNELVALDPKGKLRWALARPSVRFPRWTGTRTDTRIVYLTRGRLHLVAGDGTGDRDLRLAPAAPTAPAWRPRKERVFAYATKDGRVLVYDLDRGLVGSRAFGAAPTKLEWSSDGRRLLVLAPSRLRVYDARGRIVAQDDPSEGSPDLDASFRPGTYEVAVTRRHGAQSTAFVLPSGDALFNSTGVFRQLAWSPNGRWLLVTWPTANQWVFVRRGARRRIVAASRIASQLGGFPRIEGWCCTN
jgi:hypothetical protein